jgi:dihydropteroate synthase
MGIVNVTPDSFSEGGAALSPAQAIARCAQVLAEGADILDIGGESSRPGALPVSVEEELARVQPVLAAAVGLGVPVSIDTTKVEVMRVALDLGVDIVNDIAGLRTPGALELVAAHPACGVCLMHMRGTPRSMQAEAVYHDVVAEVVAFLRERIDAADAAGIGHERIVADPGIGFGKTPAQNLELLAHQDVLLTLGVPILVGWSRKSTLARLAGLAATAPAGRSTAARARLESASVVAAVLAVQRGACVVRVHDVAATVAGLAVWQAAHDADNRADLSSDRASIP